MNYTILFLILLNSSYFLCLGLDGQFYSTENSDLVTNYVSQLSVDSKNRIWIATDEGVMFSNVGSWGLNDSANSEMEHTSIRSLNIDSNDNVWFGYDYFSGVVIFENFKYRDINPSKISNYLKEIIEIKCESNNRIWFRSSYYLISYEKELWTIIETSGQPRSMAVDSRNRLWFTTTNDTIYIYDNGEISSIDLAESGISKENSLRNLTFDNKGTLWFTDMYGDRLDFYNYNPDTKEWKKFSPENSPIRNSINRIRVDRNNHIWFLAYHDLYKYDGENWESYPVSDYLPEPPEDSPFEQYFYWDFIIDKRNNIWLTAYAAGVLKLSDIISNVDQEPLDIELTISPNPAKEKITINSKSQLSFTSFIISNVEGKELINYSKSSMVNNTVDISGLSSGVYFIELTDIEGKYFTKKFVVE